MTYSLISFESAMQEKIAKEREIVDRRYKEILQNRSIQPGDQLDSLAGLFYWGDRDLRTCGSASIFTQVEFSFPLLPQLLMTPCLIVDILPLPEFEYKRRYGLTIEQLQWLIDGGFVIPNIYYYFDDGWREYSKFEFLWPILLHKFSRINAEWIATFFDKQRFSNKKLTAEKFFAEEISKVTNEEVSEILAGMRRAIPSVDRLPAVCGHQLAYLEVSKDWNFRLAKVLATIRRQWKTSGQRSAAIRLLKAAQGLVIGALTAAYGGRSHMLHPQYDEYQEYAARVIPLKEGTDAIELLRELELRDDLRLQASFCVHIVNELSSLNLLLKEEHERASELGDVFPLNDEDFDKFKNILQKEVIRQGALAMFADEMRSSLIETGVPPDTHAYLSMRDQLTELVKPWPFLPKFLHHISTVSRDVAQLQLSAPPSDLGLALFISFSQFSGVTSFAAEKLEGKEYIALWASSKSRVLCDQWRKIRRQMEEI